MDVGIGIPNTVPGATGQQLLDWAQRAERAGFSTLASIGAVAYPGYEELTVFAAAAAVTERIRMLSNVIVAPARSAAELAKQAITVDQLSDGRLTLGLGVGWRETDYTLSGRDFSSRGKAFDEMLPQLRSAWHGEPLTSGIPPVGPQPVQSEIPLLIGGTTPAAIRRTVEFGSGWTAGGLPPQMVADFAGQVRDAWRDSPREDQPRIVALAYFSLGDTEAESRDALLDYYRPRGQETATMIADSALRSPEAITGAVRAFTEAGVDELILDPTVADPQQVDLLAEVVT